MGLEPISSSIYHDPANLMKKTDLSVQDQGVAAPMGAPQTPAVAKPSGSNQFGSDQEKGQKDGTTSKQQIKSAISRFNNTVRNSRTRLELTYHEKINRVSIKILDEETDEVIREIPPEEAIDMIEKMMELAGLLFDERR